MRRRRLLAFATLAVLVAGMLTGAGPAAAEPPAMEPAAPAGPGLADPPRQITLLTGDRVTIQSGQITVPPREGVQFIQVQQDGHDLLIPSDAIPLLQADRLDERLFDVTGLLAYGFDELPHLPLVVSDAQRLPWLPTGEELPVVDGFATTVPVDELAATWPTTRDSLTSGKIWLDAVREPALDDSAPMVGAPALWEAGFDGTGVTVAVLDTGIDDTHPDLAGRVADRQNFVAEYETALDFNGHGTHVASTLGGAGGRSGVAPGVTLLDGKVCWYESGRGLCSDSAILDAMYWAAESGARVVNMSLGGPDYVGVDPLEQAINDITEEYGTLFVVSAGNDNGSVTRVASPSTADAALSVANLDKAGDVYWSSLPGPRIGDYAVKPEIAAPGTLIEAARAPGAGDHLPAGPYVPLTGTSMASPHVAGAAALLAQAQPDWQAAELKAALMGAASPNPAYGVYAQGAGQLNVEAALRQPVTASPPSLNLGELGWPHTGGPETHTVTYHNRADAPVTLELAVSGDVPADLLTLGESTLAVPAGGKASVTVTVEPGASEDYGVFGGWLTASAVGMQVRTPFGGYHEAPSADLHVTALDRDGELPSVAIVDVRDLTNGTNFVLYEPSQTVRVPLGSTWAVGATIIEEDGAVAMVRHHQLVVDADQELVLDARLAQPLDLGVPDPDATPYQATVRVTHTGDSFWFGSVVWGDPRTIFTVDLGPSGLAGMTTEVHAVFEGPDQPVDRNAIGAQAPDVYHLAWEVPGSFMTGLTDHPTRRELATVTAEYAQNALGAVAVRRNISGSQVLAYGLGSELPPVSTPARRTEYLLGGLTWNSQLTEVDPATTGWTLALEAVAPTAYRAGRTYRERWNGGVLSPTLTVAGDDSLRAMRDGNLLYATLSRYSDGAGHIGTPMMMTNHHITLHRGRELVGEFEHVHGFWEVGPEPATYRISYSMELPEPFQFNRRVETEWRFISSAQATGPLPVTSIEFRPELRIDNSVPAGSRQDIPLVMVGQPGAATVRTVRMSVSFDDGDTWNPVAAPRRGGDYVAMVRHPRQPGFVSLRATAVDRDGNQVTTTIYRAYAVR